MADFHTLEPAIDPNNRIAFLLDWELTMKCNLDCSYCATGLYGGHDNSTKHPPRSECINSIDFMFAYADLYMQRKPKGLRYVILNVYGGESLNHPDIVEILSQVHEKYKPYRNNWHLTVTTTTNAIVSKKKLDQIIPMIDEFTVSYHTNNTAKQKQQFKENLLTIHQSGRRQKCVVLMHPEPDLFADANDMIAWLNAHGIKHMPKQLDHQPNTNRFNYDSVQIKWFDRFYNKSSFNSQTQIDNQESQNKTDLAELGRACCGGRQVCKDLNYKSRDLFVANKFTDWYCSVNHFFLYIKQVNGEIYVNKDCKMNFDGTVSPIGTLDNTESLLASLKTQLDNKTLPTIRCAKSRCHCGICAPKSQDLDTYNQIMEKYQR